MILMRDTTPATIRLGTVISSLSTPSTRIRTRSSRPDRPCFTGLRLEVDVRCPALGRLGDDRMDEFDDRRVFGRLAQVDDLHRRGAILALFDRLLNRVLESVHARDQGLDVLHRGHG